MTARSRWGIGGSAIFLVIAAVAFLGSTRSRNSVQARGIPSDSATATVVFCFPWKGRRRLGNHAGGSCCRRRSKGRVRERRSVR